MNWAWNSLTNLSPLEVHEVLAVRQRVFIVEQRCAYRDADEFDHEAIHLIGRDPAKTLIAYARVTLPNTRFREPSIGRVLVVPEHRGSGLGKLAVIQCINCCDERFGGLGIRLSAQQYLERFYANLGFRQVRGPYDEDGIPHVEMVRSAQPDATPKLI